MEADLSVYNTAHRQLGLSLTVLKTLKPMTRAKMDFHKAILTVMAVCCVGTYIYGAMAAGAASASETLPEHISAGTICKPRSHCGPCTGHAYMPQSDGVERQVNVLFKESYDKTIEPLRVRLNDTKHQRFWGLVCRTTSLARGRHCRVEVGDADDPSDIMSRLKAHAPPLALFTRWSTAYLGNSFYIRPKYYFDRLGDRLAGLTRWPEGLGSNIPRVCNMETSQQQRLLCGGLCRLTT